MTPSTCRSSGGQAQAGPGAAERQYLRLPVESARKLRWYDKGELPAITKTHLQEKRELNEAISILKKVLIRSGAATEAELDLELRCACCSSKIYSSRG